MVAFTFIHAVGQGRSRWFINDSFDIETGQLARILGGLTLRVVEIGRHSDDRLGDLFTKIVFRGLLHFLQYFGRNLRWRFFITHDFYPGITVARLDDFVRHHADVLLHHVVFVAAPDQALYRKQGVAGVRH